MISILLSSMRGIFDTTFIVFDMEFKFTVHTSRIGNEPFKANWYLKISITTLQVQVV